MTKRFTIERDPPADRPGRRYLGHDDAGRIGWVPGFVPANHFATEDAVSDFIQHRLAPLGVSEGRIIAYTVH